MRLNFAFFCHVYDVYDFVYILVYCAGIYNFYWKLNFSSGFDSLLAGVVYGIYTQPAASDLQACYLSDALWQRTELAVEHNFIPAISVAHVYELGTMHLFWWWYF